MNYTKDEVMEYVREEDVKFIRLAFCDLFGRQKNISIMPGELERAFDGGIPFYPSAVCGFEGESSLTLRPDPATLSVLPWRPEHGRVVRMYSAVTVPDGTPDGTPHPADTRSLLKKAASDAEKTGVCFLFGLQQTFYLFRTDEDGRTTGIPYDRAGYMDIAPEDRGENIRREVCLTLEQMGIRPESSCHEEGPGQNKIDFHFSDALSAADNAMTFQTVVRTVAHRNGLAADFSPKPLDDAPGNGCHINYSVTPTGRGGIFPDKALASVTAGILSRLDAMTAFLNPTEGSYKRLAGRSGGWSGKDRSRLVWIPEGQNRAEVRSPDPGANPYLALTLLIRAGLEGIGSGAALPPEGVLSDGKSLPVDLLSARSLARDSGFIRDCLPAVVRKAYGAD